MPLNLIKVYSDFLELAHMREGQRNASLRGVFNRDIQENPVFRFRNKRIYPVKGEEDAMQILFRHLTCKSEDVEEDGQKYKRRDIFDIERSKRLHWIRHHIEEQKVDNMRVFSSEERIKGQTEIRTYIHDIDQEYVIVLKPQRTNTDYYLITAHFLNESWAKKAMSKRYKKRLAVLY